MPPNNLEHGNQKEVPAISEVPERKFQPGLMQDCHSEHSSK